MAVVLASVAERLSVGLTATPVGATPALLAEVLILKATAPRQFRRLKASVNEKLKLLVVAGLGRRYNVAMASRLALRDKTRTGQSARLASRLALQARVSGPVATVLRERLRLSVAASTSATYLRLLREHLRVTDALPRYSLGASLRSSLALSSGLGRTYRAVARLQATLALHGAAGPQFMLVAVARDTLVLDQDISLGAIYRGLLSDGLQFIIDVVDPGGGGTAWAMNVRTGAVTEYMNYDFNSFARARAGTYLGASDDGLYELVGQDDAGEGVIADMIGGLMDLSGSFLTGFQAAYLGIRGEGEFFLRLTAGTGRTSTYAVKVSSLRTARVNLGKGLRARYFTYELISTGQDFDLGEITFLPIQSTRRI